MKKAAASKYIPSEIEKKWQDTWVKKGTYQVDIEAKDKNYYMLVELPYTSGDLHMGHWFTFTYGDVLARFKRMQGYNVLFPNGFDAFGLPAENAAIKRGIHPKDWTYQNMDRMRQQFDTLGTAIDWRYTMVACDPGYYRWNQWIFLKLLEKGLAYRAGVLSNWCPSCQTVLANENVENGKCWRCGSEVVQKEVEQWFFKITEYADRLIWQDPPQADWPKSLRVAQNDWIGRSEGMEIEFKMQNAKCKIKVFTTKPETIDGATFIVIAPEHPLVSELRFTNNEPEVMNYVTQALAKQDQERLIDAKKKTGVDTGYQAINPVNGKLIPVYIADYVLGKYGTGAVMGVPFADERDKAFAKAYNLPIVPTSFDAKPEGKKRVQYHLHDWSISRQRYWGTPVPIINCEACGAVPVPEKDLPVELPYEVDYVPKGKPPLASNEEWFHTTCPKCGGKATRDPETLDTFIDSAWYFFRYLDPENSSEIFSKDRARKWMPLDVYIGGPEHTFGHALYSRFITMFFKDLGLIDFDEYAKVRLHHGTILGPDGARMSKSKGNVVNPDEEVKKFGADAIRLYLSFLGPFDITTAWNPDGVYGVFNFLKRIWDLQNKLALQGLTLQPQDLYMMHKTIKKVGQDIGNVKYNTAIAVMMEWLNHLSAKQHVSKIEYTTLLQLLAPFAPHITEELWQSVGEAFSIHKSSWPAYDEKYLVQDTVIMVIQVNGKVRDNLQVDSAMITDQSEVEELAKSSEKVAKHLEGKEIRKVIYVQGKIMNFVVA